MYSVEPNAPALGIGLVYPQAAVRPAAPIMPISPTSSSRKGVVSDCV